MNDPELIEIYTQEAEGHLRSIAAGLSFLQQEPNSRETLQDVRRRVHTLKSAAAVVGFQEVSSLSHRLEDLLDILYDASAPVSAEALQVLLEGTDILDRLSREPVERLHPAMKSLDARLGALTSRRISAASSGSDSAKAYSSETPRTEGITREGNATSLKVIRVRQSDLDGLTRLMNELIVCRTALERRVYDLESHLQELQRSHNTAVHDLDGVLNEFGNVLLRESNLMSVIRDSLTKVRLLPIRLLIPRLRRAVYLAAEQQNKKAELLLEGNDLELETTLIDHIIDPLLHLLRNAVAHGLESPEARRQAGKPETGTIVVRASQDETYILLEVSDDGRGLDTEGIRKAAVRCGYVSQADAESMKQEDLHNFIFMPGLTTAAELTDVAGRGVGMDAVAAAVHRLAGSIALESVSGSGVRFTLRLPRTVMITEFGEVSSSTQLKPAMIMTVDDSPSVRLANSKLIQNAGWTAITAKDGLDALEQLSHLNSVPKAILLDVEMAPMDGYEFLTKLKEDEAYRDIPVIMITSKDSSSYRKRALDLGACEFVVKPYDEQTLLRCLRHFVN